MWSGFFLDMNLELQLFIFNSNVRGLSYLIEQWANFMPSILDRMAVFQKLSTLAKQFLVETCSIKTTSVLILISHSPAKA